MPGVCGGPCQCSAWVGPPAAAGWCRQSAGKSWTSWTAPPALPDVSLTPPESTQQQHKVTSLYWQCGTSAEAKSSGKALDTAGQTNTDRYNTQICHASLNEVLISEPAHSDSLTWHVASIRTMSKKCSPEKSPAVKFLAQLARDTHH